MNNDFIIDTIHDVRCQVSALFNHDAKKLVQYYRELQQQHLDKIVVSKVNTGCIEKHTISEKYTS